MKDLLINILINLYGEDFLEDFREHIALLKYISYYRLYKRMAIERQCIEDFNNLCKELRDKYCDNNYNDDTYWSYSEWFKEVFIEDYYKAVAEVNRKENIIRIAREAVYENIAIDCIYNFFNVYNLSNVERTKFWLEYRNTQLDTISSTGRV